MATTFICKPYWPRVPWWPPPWCPMYAIFFVVRCFVENVDFLSIWCLEVFQGYFLSFLFFFFKATLLKFFFSVPYVTGYKFSLPKYSLIYCCKSTKDTFPGWYKFSNSMINMTGVSCSPHPSILSTRISWQNLSNAHWDLKRSREGLNVFCILLSKQFPRWPHYFTC